MGRAMESGHHRPGIGRAGGRLDRGLAVVARPRGGRDGLEALRRGRKAHVVRSTAPGPVGRLVRAFNSAATEVQSRAARLEQDRQQLIVVLEAMAEAVIAVDTRHHLLFANAGANRLFGLDAGSVGRLVEELIRSPRSRRPSRRLSG